MKSEVAIDVGRVLQLVDELDKAAFKMANVTQSHLGDDEPGAHLVTIEAVAILNRIRGLTGGSMVTITRHGFAYSLGQRPLSKAGKALLAMKHAAWGIRP